MRKLMIVGLVIVLVGFGVLVLGAASQGNASTGGVIFIGPFPIVFGSGPSGPSLALLSVIIGAVMLILVVLWSWGALGRRHD